MLIWASAGVTGQSSSHSTRSPYCICVRHLDCCVFRSVAECRRGEGPTRRATASPQDGSVSTLPELPGLFCALAYSQPSRGSGSRYVLQRTDRGDSNRYPQPWTCVERECGAGLVRISWTTCACRESRTGNSGIASHHQAGGALEVRGAVMAFIMRGVGHRQDRRARAAIPAAGVHRPLTSRAGALLGQSTSLHLHRRSP